jgi:YVTN family beta-propeller protein
MNRVALAALLVLTGCGGGAHPTPAASPTPTLGVALRARTGDKPCGVLGTPGAVWVSDFGQADVVRLDPATGHVALRVKVGEQPCGMAYGAGSVWVENYASDDVTRLDATTGKVLATVEVGDAPFDVAYGAGSVWVTNHGAGSVSRIDPRTNRVVATVRGVGTPPASRSPRARCGSPTTSPGACCASTRGATR